MTKLPTDPRILEHLFFKAALNSRLAPPERETILALFTAHPEVAWLALDQMVLPPRLEPTDDPLVRTLRRLIHHDTRGLDGPALLLFKQAHQLPDGFARLFGIEREIAAEEKRRAAPNRLPSPRPIGAAARPKVCAPLWAAATVALVAS